MDGGGLDADAYTAVLDCSSLEGDGCADRQGRSRRSYKVRSEESTLNPFMSGRSGSIRTRVREG